MPDIKCPYCQAELYINHDDGYGYDDDGTYQQTCKHCDKTFVYTTTICFYYDAEKADCLNDGEHQFEKTRYSRLRCKMCGEEKPMPKGE